MKDFNAIEGIFPCPICITDRGSVLDQTEEKEIEKIIVEEGMRNNIGNSTSKNSDIFNGNLKKLKQFCDEQVNLYVKKIMNPKEGLNFYITQSWLNVTKPGEWHHNHSHATSIISGVFYVSTGEDDRITFSDPNANMKEMLRPDPEEYNIFNSVTWSFPSVTNELILFPSWLNHEVEVNEKATTDRISLSFNTFVRGTCGKRQDLTKLILK